MITRASVAGNKQGGITLRTVALSLISAAAVTATHAQNGVNSPFSRYGFGILSERSTGFNKGMGGVAQGFRNGTEINVANPASYSAVDSLTALFDMGITLQNGNYQMSGLRQNVRNSSFDYFAFQFRLRRNAGMTVALMPLSNIKYKFATSKSELTSSTSVTHGFDGDGGLREVLLGAGWRPFRALSVGLNAGYVWGEYTHNMTMSLSESASFNVRRAYKSAISTYQLQGGLQLIQPIGASKQIVAGATYTLGHDVGSDATRSTETINGMAVESQRTDTVRNAFQLPHSIAVGLTYYDSERLRVGVDFELQKWSKCRFPNQQTSLTGDPAGYAATTGQLNDHYRISAGMDWTPSTAATASLLKRTTYKVGGHYSQIYAKPEMTGASSKPYEFGVAAGVAIPISNSNTWRMAPKLNVSLQWTHTHIPYQNVASMQQSALTENYLKLCVGLTFNERWFYKWKVQ